MIDAAIPSLITLLGHLASLAWLAGAHPLFAMLGLACDVADGWSARRLGTASDFGSLYDWQVDCTMATLVAGRLGWWPLVALLVPLQVALRQEGIRFSGRALLVGLALWAGR